MLLAVIAVMPGKTAREAPIVAEIIAFSVTEAGERTAKNSQ
jgi:hypothetical protein